jgi:hypothetical protein
MKTHGWVLVSSAAIALGATQSMAEGGRGSERTEIARLIRDLPSDNVPRNMDNAVFDLVQRRSPLTTPMLIDAWYAASDRQSRDAITAVLWYRNDAALAYRREIIDRTLSMLVSAERDGPTVNGTLYGNDTVAMQFLVEALEEERESGTQRSHHPKSSTVTERVRSLARLGSERGRFLACCLLSVARDESDTDHLVRYLLPHLRDNDIKRDAMSATRALVEIAQTSPLQVELLRLEGDPQTQEAARTALDADPDGEVDDPQPPHWPRLPRVESEFDALHANHRWEANARQGEATWEFVLGGVTFRYYDDAESVRSGADPMEVIEAYQGNRWVTVCAGRWVRPAIRGFDGEIAIGEDADELRRGFNDTLLRGPGDTEFIVFRVDSGGASGRGWRHVLIPVRDGLASLGETATFLESSIDADGAELCISEPDVDCRLRLDADITYNRWEIEIAYQWDGRCWAPTIDPDPPLDPDNPDL